MPRLPDNIKKQHGPELPPPTTGGSMFSKCKMNQKDSDAVSLVRSLQQKIESFSGKPVGLRHLLQELSNAPAEDLNLLGHKVLQLMGRYPFKQLHFVPQHIGSSSAQLLDLTEDLEFMSFARPCVESGNNLLQYDRLYTIYQSLRQVIARFPIGEIVTLEAGVYRGHTSAFICRILEAFAPGRGRHFAVDTFSGHSGQDLPNGREGAHKVGLFGDTSQQAVEELLSRHLFARVLPGRVQDVAPGLGENAFHFVHLDMDLMEPTKWSLNFFTPLIPAGGVIVVDDLRKRTCPGIVESVSTFLSGNPSLYHFVDVQNAQGVLSRL